MDATMDRRASMPGGSSVNVSASFAPRRLRAGGAMTSVRLSAAEVAAIEARHQLAEQGEDHWTAYRPACVTCGRPWPCDARRLLDERAEMLSAGDGLMAAGDHPWSH
jgi:hypothetical protein